MFYLNEILKEPAKKKEKFANVFHNKANMKIIFQKKKKNCHQGQNKILGFEINQINEKLDQNIMPAI
jgi:predicted nucleotidyltransferase